MKGFEYLESLEDCTVTESENAWAPVESFTMKDLVSRCISNGGGYNVVIIQRGATSDVDVPGDAARSGGVPGPQLPQQISDDCNLIGVDSLQPPRPARLNTSE